MFAAAFALLALAAGTHLVPVNPDSLGPYQPVFLNAPGTRLSNCDSTALYSTLERSATEKDHGHDSVVYNRFLAGGHPVRQLTFLRAAGDTIFLLATVEKNRDVDDYAKFCVEKNAIGVMFAERDIVPPSARRKDHRGRGAEGRAELVPQLIIVALVVALILAIQYWG